MSSRPMPAPTPIVLVIEDEPQMRRFLATTLRSCGYQLVEAATAREGLAQAAGRNPDVILLDLGLPDGDGLAGPRRVTPTPPTPVKRRCARGPDPLGISAHLWAA